MAMVSRRTGQLQGCAAPLCFDRGCHGCGDGLGFHVGTVGRGTTIVEIGGLFPRRVTVHATVARGDDGEVLDPRKVHAECDRFGFRVLRREHWLWDTHLWTWDANEARITIYRPHVRMDPAPGVEVVHAFEEAA